MALLWGCLVAACGGYAFGFADGKRKARGETIRQIVKSLQYGEDKSMGLSYYQGVKGGLETYLRIKGY